jgi:hypothetical protein
VCREGSSFSYKTFAEDNFIHGMEFFLKIEPFAKLGFSFKIKPCEKFYHRHIIDIPVNMAGTEIISAPPG